MTNHPRAQAAAQKVASCIQSLATSRSAPTRVGVVADVGSLLTQGYVSVTTGANVVKVVGAQVGQLIPGMTVYIRPLNLNTYLLDGVASVQPPRMGAATISRAICYDGLTPGVAAALTQWQRGTQIGQYGQLPPTYNTRNMFWNLPSVASSLDGMFWSFSVSLSGLPNPGAKICLMDMALVDQITGNVDGGFQLLYDSQGHLIPQFYGTAFGSPAAGTPTVETFAPHRTWWLTMQIRNGLAMDGQTVATIPAHLNGMHQLVGGSYALAFLGDVTGANTPPAGSWVSQIICGFGNPNGTATWPYPINTHYVPGTTNAISNIVQAVSDRTNHAYFIALSFQGQVGAALQPFTAYVPGPIPTDPTVYQAGNYGIPVYKGNEFGITTGSLPVYGSLINTGPF